ncbi:MAG: amidohydrolase family protein, partial [Acidobacteriota bacterium]
YNRIPMNTEKRIEVFLKLVLLVSLIVGFGSGCGTSQSELTFEEIDKIDVHSHIFDDVEGLAEMLERIHLRIINVCNRGTDRFVLVRMEEMAEELNRKYGNGILPFASTIDLVGRDEPEYAESVIEWLGKSFENGSLMVKIWKDVGLELKNPDGSFLMPNDPRFDPIYDYLAGQNKPLLAHLAEPLAAWLPLDPENVHYGYYSNNPEWHLYGRSEYPSHEDLMAARDSILEKHPNLILIGAHMGSMSHDVAEVAKRLDRYANFYVECSARTADLTRQDAKTVREFFIKYQDRVLYGLDMTRNAITGEQLSAEEQRAFVDRLEERYRQDFQYYAGTGRMEYRGKEIECLGLPKDVLEKFYSGNAQRLMPGLGN